MTDCICIVVGAYIARLSCFARIEHCGNPSIKHNEKETTYMYNLHQAVY